MESKLIIIRGNSGSGKSTIAQTLQKKLGAGTLLVSQDTVRREMLHVSDNDQNLSIDLIKQIALYGLDKTPVVIVEGILVNKRYRSMLMELITLFNKKSYVYYFDLPFGVTLIRHNQRMKSTEFGEKELKAWWNHQDYLNVTGEQIFKEDMTEDDIVKKIIADLNLDLMAN